MDSNSFGEAMGGALKALFCCGVVIGLLVGVMAGAITVAVMWWTS